MRRIALIALALCLVQALPAKSQHDKGGLADTLRVDMLLDSAKAGVARGETETPVTLAREALALLDGIRRAVPGAPGQHERRMQAHKLEAVAHHYAGRYAPALAGFQRMEREADTLGLPKDVAAALTYQGYEYRTTGDLARAAQATLRAIAALRTLPEGPQLANALAAMGAICSDRDEWDSAMYYQRASAVMQHRLGNTSFEALSHVDIAALYGEKQRYDSAYAELQLAKPVLMADPNVTQQVILLVHEARVLFGLGRIAEARRNLEAALPMAREVGNDESLQHIQETWALVAAASGQYAEAIREQDSSRKAMLRDLDLAKVEAVAAVRLEGEHAKQRAVARARMAEVQQQKRYVMIGCGLLLVIAALLFLQLRTVRRKNAAILRAQQQVVEAEKQREAEEVRTRIARDIHDEIGSGLTKIALLGNEAKFSMNVSQEALKASLDRMISHSREVGAALGDIVWAVDPAADTMGELVGHAGHLAHRLLDHAGVEPLLKFNSSELAQPVTPDLRHHVLMVMKEAINNALKYAEAKHVQVELEAQGTHFVLSVKDDGKGFDPADKAGAGHGLRNMQARAEAIGARLAVESAPGQGCTVRLEGGMA